MSYIIKEDFDNIEIFLATEDLDFEAFKLFVSENLLAGSIYSILINPHLKTFFPDKLLNDFKLFYMLQWTRNETLTKEILQLAELFEAADKEVIFLKGPFMSYRFFGNIDRRFIADIDILVKEEDIYETEQLLLKNGYKPSSNIFLSEKKTRYFVHHYEYRKHGIVVELHWVFSRHFSFNLNYRKIWHQKIKFVFREQAFFVLSDEYELIFQILSILKDIELGEIAFRSFQDVYAILKAVNNHINWQIFFDDRNKEGLLSISVNILDLILDILDCHYEFKELSHCIEDKRAYIRYKDTNKKIELLKRSRFAIGSKLWSFKLYDTHPFKAFCWWAVSLPFRLIVHKEQSLTLLRR